MKQISLYEFYSNFENPISLPAGVECWYARREYISPFSFSDLRFLSRLVTGTPLLQDESIIQLASARASQISLAAACYVSTLRILKYQDAVGLYDGEEFAQIALTWGELLQHSCLLALLQRGLVDLSPKWAPLRATQFGGRLGDHATAGLRQLTSYMKHDPASWARHCLRISNSIVAAGVIDAIQDYPSVVQESRREIWAPEQCLMGIPKYLSVLNARTSKLAVVNRAYLNALL